ncbi:hypothetical protein Fcan01_11500 [Folsomia candida]|uniref:Uncharacterized protein n=1 Tax=Folsomia candida TaxID=158441 RepID=A0A226EDA1_FOLCA|nr:hypothetical protein Fcan01_11500 [Folsomia candida]
MSDRDFILFCEFPPYFENHSNPVKLLVKSFIRRARLPGGFTISKISRNGFVAIFLSIFFCLGLIRSSLGWNLFPWTGTSSLGNFTREKLSSLRNQRNRLQSLVIEEERAEIGEKEEKVTLNSSLASKFSRKNFVKNFVPVNEIIEKMSDKRKPQSFDPRLELVDRMLKSEKMKNILNLFPIDFGIKIKKILKIDGLKDSHDDYSGINLAASRGGGGGGWGWGQGMEIDAFTILAALAFLTFLMSVLAQLLASVTTTGKVGITRCHRISGFT